MKEQIHLGTWSKETLNDLIKEASAIKEPGERIDVLSRNFLNTKYEDSTLSGDVNTPEVFIINLGAMDCFTFIDYIEALRQAKNFSDFVSNVKKLRYRHGMVAFENRNHFFTDWKACNADSVVDVTETIGGGESKDVRKRLNEKGDGTFYLPGIPCRLREITYIQSTNVEEKVLGNVKSGDYAGIYSKKEGLDVSHVGILIRKGNAVYFRHASSLKKYRKVIDEDFREYLKAKPGIIILRPRD